MLKTSPFSLIPPERQLRRHVRVCEELPQAADPLVPDDDDRRKSRRIPVKVEDGRPLLLADVSQVEYGNEIRRGVVTLNGNRVG